MTTKIGIIGTAGRKGDAELLNPEVFERALNLVKNYISSQGIDTSNVTLVSGGAAWMDHVAVRLYLDGYCPNLDLYLPCKWDETEYYDTGKVDWISNPGGTSNYYHRRFSKTSLSEIAEAIKRGANVIIGTGLLERNNGISQNVDILIALTFDDTTPTDGGTRKTWDAALKRQVKCVHLSLNDQPKQDPFTIILYTNITPDILAKYKLTSVPSSGLYLANSDTILAKNIPANIAVVDALKQELNATIVTLSDETRVVCVKVKYLRKNGFNHLREWMNDPSNVYIGRGRIIDFYKFPPNDSIWANPYKVPRDGTIEEVLDKYETYLMKKLDDGTISHEQLMSLQGKNLGCWCKEPDNPCHGDVIVKLLTERSK